MKKIFIASDHAGYNLKNSIILKFSKKQKIIEVKEIKLRPNIDNNDFIVKMKQVKKFIDNGDKVKITLRFRGREMAHQTLGATVLDRVKEETEELCKVETVPKLEGRQMVMILAPK